MLLHHIPNRFWTPFHDSRNRFDRFVCCIKEQNFGALNLLLRRQLKSVERKMNRRLRVSRAEQFSLAILTLQLKRTTEQSVKDCAM